MKKPGENKGKMVPVRYFQISIKERMEKETEISMDFSEYCQKNVDINFSEVITFLHCKEKDRWLITIQLLI